MLLFFLKAKCAQYEWRQFWMNHCLHMVVLDVNALFFLWTVGAKHYIKQSLPSRPSPLHSNIFAQMLIFAFLHPPLSSPSISSATLPPTPFLSHCLFCIVFRAQKIPVSWTVKYTFFTNNYEDTLWPVALFSCDCLPDPVSLFCYQSQKALWFVYSVLVEKSKEHLLVVVIHSSILSILGQLALRYNVGGKPFCFQIQHTSMLHGIPTPCFFVV